MLLRHIKERKIQIYKELLTASYLQFGLYDWNIQTWNYNAEIANDKILNDYYQRIDDIIKTA